MNRMPLFNAWVTIASWESASPNVPIPSAGIWYPVFKVYEVARVVIVREIDGRNSVKAFFGTKVRTDAKVAIVKFESGLLAGHLDVCGMHRKP
jgi:hypothetical protein